MRAHLGLATLVGCALRLTMLLFHVFQASMLFMICFLSICPSTKRKDHTLPAKGAIHHENGFFLEVNDACSLCLVICTQSRS